MKKVLFLALAALASLGFHSSNASLDNDLNEGKRSSVIRPADNGPTG